MIRLRCSYQVSCAMLGKRFAAQVVDMGLEGLRLEVAGQIEPKQLLALRYEGPAGCYDFDTVQARVVWSRPVPERSITEVGVVYLHPPAFLERSWVRHLLRVFDLDKMTVRDRRGDVRVLAPFGASMLDADPDARAATVRNLGLGGVLLESMTAFPVGGVVRVALTSPDGETVACEGQVVRTARIGREERWLLGVRFPAPPAEYREQIGRVLQTAHG